MPSIATPDDSVRTDSPPGDPTWKAAMKAAIRDPAALCRRLDLPPEYEAGVREAAESLPVFVPPAYLARIQPGDPHDPLLRQVLPLAEELQPAPGFTFDAVGDAAAQTAPRLLQKYQGRALMLATGVCAVHCRYCFRRHFPYQDHAPAPDRWAPALEAIRADASLDEVLLSGGDPLTLDDAPLANLIGQLDAIGHLRRLRIHTRLPVVIPQRITPEFLALLRKTRLAVWVVVHVNHPAEIDQEVAAALGAMIDAGVPVLNQAVLLRGVNDSADVLTELCLKLSDLRILPYYLHQLDRVAGAAHFETPLEQGLEIMQVLRARLPGYAVPRFVKEEAGKLSKTVLA